VKSALDVHRELLAAGVAHEMVRVRGGVLSADDLPVGLGADPQGCVAVRCYIASYDDAGARSVAGHEQFVAVLVRAGDTPDPASLLEALQAAAIRPSTDAETNATTDYAAALVCPVGLGADVLLLADAALGTTDVLYTATGESGVALGIRTRDLLVAAGARATTLTARRLEPVDRTRRNLGAGLGLPGAQVVNFDAGRRAAAPARQGIR
jgi:prolyl-tRNA editing enzyme YbaK/EbsC (Cys-tRNA(Pro) deacylase)